MKTLTSAPRTSPLTHLLRVALLSAALSAIATIVAADVLAAEPEELADAALAALDLIDEDEDALLGEEGAGPALYAAAIQIPDAAAPLPQPSLDELLEAEPKVEKKKRRKSKKGKLYGRFEGY